MSVTFYPEKEVGGIKGWYWPTVDVQTWTFIRSDWEESHHAVLTKLFSEQGRQTRTAVQAGGNCGMYPRLLAQMFESVYTFEPDPLNFFTLNLNCSVDNIYKIQAALGSKSGNVSMIHRTMSNVGMHMVDQQTGKIPMITLDSMHFEFVDLLWLDIEEFEGQALLGAEQTIRKHNPVILCENANPQIVEHLKQLNYQMVGSTAMDGIFCPQPL